MPKENTQTLSPVNELTRKIFDTLSHEKTYFDVEKNKLIFPEHIIKRTTVEANYEAIYEGCEDDVKRAFYLHLENDPIAIEDLTDAQKKHIRKTLKKAVRSMPKAPGGTIVTSKNWVWFADEFEKVLEIIEQSKCFCIEGKDGKLRGVKPPKNFHCMVSGPEVPWHLLVIDFRAQRGSDVIHLVDKLLDYDPVKNFNLTGRFEPDGTQVDINDGRHSAMLLALVGAPYVLVRGAVCDDIITNMNTFEILNSLAKPIREYDEMNFMYNRAKLQKDDKGVGTIDTTNRKTGTGLFTNDREIYEMFQLLKQYKFQLVDSTQGEQKRRHLEPKMMFRPDMMLAFIQNKYGNYTTIDNGVIVDTFLYEALDIIQNTLTDAGGYVPHELTWAILELFAQAEQERKTLSAKERKAMAKAIKSALLDWLPVVNDNAPKKMMDRSYEFYKRVKSAKNRVTNKDKMFEFSQGNGYIQHFLSTALYSMVLQYKGISKPDKDLFVQPWFTRQETTGEDENGKAIKEKVVYYLNDDQNLPFNVDSSFMTSTKSKMDAVDIVDDEDDA